MIKPLNEFLRRKDYSYGEKQTKKSNEELDQFDEIEILNKLDEQNG